MDITMGRGNCVWVFPLSFTFSSTGMAWYCHYLARVYWYLCTWKDFQNRKMICLNLFVDQLLRGFLWSFEPSNKNWKLIIQCVQLNNHKTNESVRKHARDISLVLFPHSSIHSLKKSMRCMLIFGIRSTAYLQHTREKPRHTEQKQKHTCT